MYGLFYIDNLFVFQLEICGNSASMECGKKVLKHTPVSSNSAKENVTTNTDVQDQMTVYHRCVLRKVC